MTFHYVPQSLGTFNIVKDVWTDMDFSSIVGARSVLIFFAARYRYDTSFRTKGYPYGHMLQSSSYSETGVSGAFMDISGPEYQVIMIATDANGVIQGVNHSYTINLVVEFFGYEDQWYTVDAVSGFVQTGILPASYQDVDISAIVGARHALAAMGYRCLSNPGGAPTKGTYLRTNGETKRCDDHLVGTPRFHGASMFCIENYTGWTIGSYASPTVITDANGIYEHTTINTAQDMEIRVNGYGLLTGADTPVIALPSTTKPAGVWHELDLSPWVGEQAIVAVIKVRNDYVSGDVSIMIATRPAGCTLDTYNVLQVYSNKGCHAATVGTYDRFQTVICPTNDEGKLEYRVNNSGYEFELSLLGYFPSVVPEWDIIYPYPEGYTPEPDQIRFSLARSDGIDPSTLSLAVIETIEGEPVIWQAILLGVVQPHWDIAIAYTGATPTRIDVVIRGWPLGLSSACRRVDLVVDATSVLGVSL